MKRKLLAILLAAAMTLTFVSCASGTDTNTGSGDTTAAPGGATADLGLLTPGTLKVGMEIGYPPFEYFSDDGKTPLGVDVELAKALGKELNLEVVFEDTKWDAIFSGLFTSKYDVIMSAVTILPDRKTEMLFSEPYIENWQAIAVRKGGARVLSPTGLDGLKVGYQDETTSDAYIKGLIDTGALNCEVNEYEKVLQAFSDLKLGRIDAIICDSTVADSYVAREGDTYEISWIQSSDPDAEAETFGIAIKLGNEALQKAVNEALKKLKDNGTLAQILQDNL
ncbi:MAG: transporter substrate-binding domain-containing protein [Oscillospiraceae bacterium]|jgi:polar amino acid transport system substrate-binding protein|nr:transporter substrate-binding domain-containing protein [Oscillospiraceae bacterium]